MGLIVQSGLTVAGFSVADLFLKWRHGALGI